METEEQPPAAVGAEAEVARAEAPVAVAPVATAPSAEALPVRPERAARAGHRAGSAETGSSATRTLPTAAPPEVGVAEVPAMEAMVAMEPPVPSGSASSQPERR